MRRCDVRRGILTPGLKARAIDSRVIAIVSAGCREGLVKHYSNEQARHPHYNLNPWPEGSAIKSECVQVTGHRSLPDTTINM